MASIEIVNYPAKSEPLRGIIPDWILDNTRVEVRVPERNAVG
jgi:hypothetical protein